MYRWLRNTHLLLGLFFCAFVLMFGISSIRFSHRDWFPGKDVESKVSFIAPPGTAWEPRTLAQELMNSRELRGGLGNIRGTAEGFRFEIARMGTTHKIHYSRETRDVRIETKVQPLIAMMNVMHKTFGMDHGYGLTNLWGFLMLLTTVALLLLGVTGIYLWFKLYNERFIGVLLLLAGLAYGGTLLVLIRR